VTKIFIPFLALILLQNCKSDKGTAYDFSHFIESTYKSFYSRNEQLAAFLRSAMKTMDFEKFTTEEANLEKYIDKQIVKVTNRENVSGSEKLKAAMIEYLNFEKEILGFCSVSFGIMNETTTADEKQAALDNLRQLTRKETQYRINLYRAQQDFAAKNGFKY
jgi:hypothetical protein